MGYEHQMPFHCIADGDFPAFLLRMIGVRKCGRERIEEHCGRIFKGYAMLGEVGRRLAPVPLKSHARSLSHAMVDCGLRWRDPHSLYIGDRKNLSSAFHNGEEMIEAGDASNGYHLPCV